MFTDKQTEIDLPLLRIEDADAEKTSTRQAGIMASISGVRRLQLGASSGGELPRYGIEVEDESSLAQVKQKARPKNDIFRSKYDYIMYYRCHGKENDENGHSFSVFFCGCHAFSVV